MSWLGCLQCPWAVALSWGYLCHPWGVCISVGHKCHALAVFIMLRLFLSCSCHPTAACVIPWLFMLFLGCLCDLFKRLFEFKNPFQLPVSWVGYLCGVCIICGTWMSCSGCFHHAEIIHIILELLVLSSGCSCYS